MIVKFYKQQLQTQCNLIDGKCGVYVVLVVSWEGGKTVFDIYVAQVKHIKLKYGKKIDIFFFSFSFGYSIHLEFVLA